MVNLRKLLTNICTNIKTLLDWKDTTSSVLDELDDIGRSPTGHALSFTAEDITIPTATRTILNPDDPITLTPGYWYVVGRIRYESNDTGNRGIYIGVSNASSLCSQTQQTTTANRTAGVNAGMVIKITSNTDYFLVGYQSSGGNLSVTTAAITAKKLGSLWED